MRSGRFIWESQVPHPGRPVSDDLKESRLVLRQIQGLRSAGEEHVSLKQVRLQDRRECCSCVWCPDTIPMARLREKPAPGGEQSKGRARELRD